MRLFQPPVTPLPEDLDLRGQTTIVTGATSGIGLAWARQLLLSRASTVILAVRNISKGEAVKRDLLADPVVGTANPEAVVEVMKLDAEDYDSVKSFAKSFRAGHRDLHIVMPNAGVAALQRRVSPTGHETAVQVNYLSNVLLMLELLPLLETTAKRTGVPGRITWTGSRAIGNTSLAAKSPLKAGETVLGYLDAEENFFGMSRYADSKLPAFLFLRELSEHYASSEGVIANAFCPGMIDTNMSNVVPMPFRLAVDAFKAVRARSPEKAAWIGLHAAAVVGAETHGKQLGDKSIWEADGFAVSEEGMRLQRLLWNETVEEMERLTTLPGWVVEVGP